MNEALYKLKKLPKDTTLTAEHILAIIDALEKSQAPKNDSKGKTEDLINEQELADWLGESVSSIQKWRVSGKGPKFIKKPKGVGYRPSDVEAWLESRTVASTTEATMKGIGFIAAIPVFHHTINGQQVRLSLEESVKLDEPPEAFEVIELEAHQMAREHIDLLQPVDASVLAKVEAAASGALGTLNFALWFYFQGIMGNLLTTDTKTVLKTIEAMHARGVNINDLFSGRAGSFTAGHLLADCHGVIFMVDYTDSRMTHKDILLKLLELGLDENIKNKDNQTPLDLANQVEAKHGLGTSMFLQTFKPWSLQKKMQATLSPKPKDKSKDWI